jgi:4-nitrophenyl phosphatase
MVCGKPSILAFQLIQDRFGSHITPETTVMFGDRIDTDIVFGKNVGCATVLTMTGVTDDEILERSEIKPDYVIQNFTELA